MNVTVRGCEKKRIRWIGTITPAPGVSTIFLHIAGCVCEAVPGGQRNRIENRPPVGNRNTPTEAITQCRDSIAARKRLRVIGGKAAALSCSSVTAFI